MKKFLLSVVLSIACICSIHGVIRCPEEKFPCVLLCDASEKDMMAYIFLDSHCCISAKTDYILEVIDPTQIYKIWMVNSRNVDFEKYVEKYCTQYSEKIRGVVLIKLKDGARLPASLLPPVENSKK